MGLIDDKIKPLTGHFYKLERNPEEGWYEMEVAIPAKWVFKSNKIIECEVLNESKAGKFVLVKPKNDTVGIDDLIEFIGLIVLTNKEISDREEEFNKQMEAEKEKLATTINSFYTGLDELRKKSFEKFGSDADEKNEEGETTKPKTKRGRPPGAKNKPKTGKVSVSGKTK